VNTYSLGAKTKQSYVNIGEISEKIYRSLVLNLFAALSKENSENSKFYVYFLKIKQLFQLIRDIEVLQIFLIYLLHHFLSKLKNICFGVL
jgi:hypothetical protein